MAGWFYDRLAFSGRDLHIQTDVLLFPFRRRVKKKLIHLLLVNV